MRIVYQFILSVYEEYEFDATQFGKRFAAPYFKEMVSAISHFSYYVIPTFYLLLVTF